MNFRHFGYKLISMISLFYAIILASDSGAVTDSTAVPMVWVQGGRNVVSSIYSPDGSIQVDSTDPTRIGISVGSTSVPRMAVIQSVIGTYAAMVSRCANLNYNGYTGWRLADAHEVIYACQKGLINCSSTTLETADIYRVLNYTETFAVVAVAYGDMIERGTETNATTYRSFVCIR